MGNEKCSEYARDLGIEIGSLSLIKENKYCLIYLAATPDGSRIVKKYKAGDPSLVRIEAEALSFYHDLAESDPHLMDSGVPVLCEDKRLLGIGFIEGTPFNEVVYSARKNGSERERAVRIMRVLERLIRQIYDRTQRPQDVTSSFIFEYFNYCSTRLENLPLLGSLLFKKTSSEAKELADEFRFSKPVPSFIHGDLVFKNIHVKDELVGLIDFANANTCSHCLNDIYNLWFALANMVLPKSLKRNLLASFLAGFGPLDFPEIISRFYYEYHRRRWLMLKLTSRHPRDLVQGLRGLLTFARPFDHKVLAP
jgi:hypothetical protein